MFGRFVAGLLLLSCFAVPVEANDWARFRGANGQGVSVDAAPPLVWGPEKNLAWQVDLPGPGSSSPIVVGDLVLVTCWTGYGLDQENPGDQQDLKRCLVAYDKSSGEQAWRVDLDARLPEDEFGGMFAQHGYASHTPVSDGERIYAYFGKSGAYTFDLKGTQLWQVDCGDGFGAKGWGSAASPILYENLVIFAATAESESLIALDKTTGREVWRRTEAGWDGVWGTPVLAEANGRVDLVLAAPFKMIGMDPATGETRWTCRGLDNDTVSTSPLAHDGVVYTIAGRGGGVAVEAGGTGDVNDSHVLWQESLRGSITTPVFYDGRLYWVGNGITCVDANTAERVYQARLEAGDDAAPADRPAEGGEGRRGRRGRRGGGRFGSMPYASPVVVGDLMYHIGRDGRGYVVRLGAEFEQIASNPQLGEGDFIGTPALSDGAMYVRSSKNLYCVRRSEPIAQR